MFQKELEAIEEIRKEFPNTGQRTLATKIVNRKFQDSRFVELARSTGERTFYSVYGAIRRIDAKLKLAVAA